MQICKAPTWQLKALNKHNIYNVHQDGECYQQFHKRLTHNVDINKDSSAFTHTQTHTDTHTPYRLIGVKDNVA